MTEFDWTGVVSLVKAKSLQPYMVFSSVSTQKDESVRTYQIAVVDISMRR